jgi:hypothetical protein
LTALSGNPKTAPTGENPCFFFCFAVLAGVEVFDGVGAALLGLADGTGSATDG